MVPSLKLNLENFDYVDLYRAEQLRRLDHAFNQWLTGQVPDLLARYQDYRAARTLLAEWLHAATGSMEGRAATQG